MSDHPRDCPHGRQWGKCDTCDLIEANKRIAALEAEVSELLPMADVAGWWQGEFQMANVDRNELRAENERLNQLSVDLRACMVEARHKLGLEQDKNDELWAVAEAARQAREALSLTREYVAPKVELPAVPGWSWYDATLALDTALAALDKEMGE